MTAKIQDALEKSDSATRPKSESKEKSVLSDVINSPTTRQIGRTVARELTRGILGVLGIGGKRRKSSGWF